MAGNFFPWSLFPGVELLGTAGVAIAIMGRMSALPALSFTMVWPNFRSDRK